VDTVDSSTVATLVEAVELVEPAVSPLEEGVAPLDPSLVVSAWSEVELHAAVSAIAATTAASGTRRNMGTSLESSVRSNSPSVPIVWMLVVSSL
jgi:hypothetical protein